MVYKMVCRLKYDPSIYLSLSLSPFPLPTSSSHTTNQQDADFFLKNKFIQSNELLLEEVKKMLAVGKKCEIEALMNSERVECEFEGDPLGYLVEFVVNRCIQKDFIDAMLGFPLF